MVVIYHASAHLRASGHELGVLFWFGQSTGFAGVDVFFVISGFIMAWTTTDSSGGPDAVSFAKRRVARIYSGYWPFYLLALAYFAWLGGNYLANAQLIRSALLWPTDLRHLLLPVSWTLIYEMFFYFLFALMIVFGGARRDFIVKVLFVFMAGWGLYSYLVRRAYDPGPLDAMSVYELYTSFPYLLEFLAGSIIAAGSRNRPQGMAWVFLLSGSALFLAGGWINENLFHGRLIQGYFIVWRVLIFGSAAALILSGLVRLEFRGLVLAPRFSLLAGGASYALYLCHTLILDWAYRMGLPGWLAQKPGWLAQAALVGVAAIIVLYSVLHYLWVERPLHRIFRKWLRA